MTPEAAVAAALPLDGWMSEEQLAQLAQWAMSCRRIVEVGVFCGRSTTAMAHAMLPDGCLYAVDDFRGEPADRADLTGPDLEAAFRRNCADLIATGRVVVLPHPSVVAAPRFATLPPLDMVFVDGSHDYASVCADLNAWQPLLRVGGALTGHDADQADVARALNDTLGAGQWEQSVGSLWRYEVPA